MTGVEDVNETTETVAITATVLLQLQLRSTLILRIMTLRRYSRKATTVTEGSTSVLMVQLSGKSEWCSNNEPSFK